MFCRSRMTIAHRHRLISLALLALVGVGAAPRDSSLVEAAKKGDQQAVHALLQKPSDVNVAAADGATALHWAVQNDDREMVDMLIRAGADVKAANRYGVRPLSIAAVTANPVI